MNAGGDTQECGLVSWRRLSSGREAIRPCKIYKPLIYSFAEGEGEKPRASQSETLGRGATDSIVINLTKTDIEWVMILFQLPRLFFFSRNYNIVYAKLFQAENFVIQWGSSS